MSSKIRMAPLDAGFLLAERQESPQHGSILLTFTPGSHPAHDHMQQLANQLRQFPVTAPRFSWIPSRDLTDRLAPAWKVLPPSDIDIDYHFRHTALPAPGGEWELALTVSRIVTQPLDLTRPLWEFHLIEGLAEGRYAVLVKMHHALMDGMTALKTIRRWLTTDSSTVGIPPIWAAEPPQPTRPKASPGRSWSPVKTLSTVRNTISSATAVGKATLSTIAAYGPHDNGLVVPYAPPESILNRPITQRRRMSTQIIDLPRVQSISAQIGGTVNDTVALILSEALRRYLIELDALPDRPLVAGVLASLRDTVNPQLAENAGNMISFIFADLATETSDIPERANRIVSSTTAGKQHLLGLGADALGYSTLALAPFIVSMATGTGHRLPMFNVGLSNVPGIRVPLYWNGARADALHATTIIANGHALVVTVTSWVDQLCFTVTACPDALPHSQRLSVHIAEALDIVEDALSAS
ncbi:wax ester/triacylglycerol synthase family O-acyltransferase [Mycobacteroides immunogenum]|uniref:wax ester/triacylglycerol synthase family O-acyltransferase n=1 Tax=Mycobacteroides immunogenum TaxID=83262 RepID=UPI0025B7945C|nr:wax ester/triacylglycerol synthase family O-acyltransferase [Mycobacteroides immunogenum]WJR32683.1 wax ester/triacylglycerol synthase family O-acyltransferase [Mycobacteroides immunogenum]